MINAFNSYHPLTAFIYFFAVILFTVFLMQPVFLCISLAVSFSYAFMLAGRRAVRFGLTLGLPIIIGLTVLNGFFNLRGETVLFYLGDRGITMESSLYGFCSALILFSVVLWFICYSEIITPDKFLYLFGKISPAASLIISMTLGLIPKLKSRLASITNAQTVLGNDVKSGRFFDRANSGLKILSVLTTWSLENSIETADSMNARGFGLKGRTAFSVFRFEKRDFILCSYIVISSVVISCFLLKGYAYFRFYPSIEGAPFSVNSGVMLFVYAAMCGLPLMLEAFEVIYWKLLK